MSWFTEIAGKAEDLLNKVDKTTATVLQNKVPKTFGSSDELYARSIPVEQMYSFASSSKSYDSSHKLPSTKFSSTSDFRSNVRASPSVKKKKPANDDEKLLQFLNSSEPIPKEPKKKSEEKSPARSKKETVWMTIDPNAQQKTGVEHAQLNSEIAAASTSEHIHTTEQLVTDQEDSPSHDTVNKEMMSASPTEDGAVRQEDVEAQIAKEETASNSLPLATAEDSPSHSELESIEQEKSDENVLQIPWSERIIRRLKERESDLTETLGAKDSQLAVLKVLLEEADQELRDKRAIVEDLKSQNERLLKSYNEEMSAHRQTIQELRGHLSQAEAELSKSREAHHALQTEHLGYVSRTEEEQRRLVENITSLQRKLADVSERNKETSLQLQNAKFSLQSLQQEYADYKQKAQRILQSKEKLIASLKEGCLDAESSPSSNETSFAMLSVETEGIKQERDLLKEELRKANETIERYRNDLQELEKMAQSDSDTAREHYRNLEEQLIQERMLKEEVQLLNVQLKEEIRFLQEELVRSKNSFQSRMQASELEIEKLRKQLMTKSLSTVSQEELESRLHALTENLIQKQTMLEALSTEKNSLVLQLERMEQQLKEAEVYGNQLHAVIGVSSPESDRKQKPSLFAESPFDSNLTRKVKKVYGSIDAFSIRSGVFFRRYPMARLFVLLYMFLLHLWVMIVLLTYEPEIHGPAHRLENGNT